VSWRPGGALIVAAVIAALGALTLLGRAGAAHSSPPAGEGDLARGGDGKRRPPRKAPSMEQERAHNEHAEVAVRGHPEAATRKEGTAMPNAVVMTGYGPPEVLKWAGVPLREPGEGQIRIKVKAAGISPTDLALRAGYLKAIPLPPNAVLGFEAAGTVDAVGPGVTGTSIGDGVTALLFSLGGYAEYAVASIWTRKPDTVSWIDAAALPSSAEAAVGVLRQLNVKSGETLLLFGGGGSVGIIATQLAVARGIKVISAVGEHDETLARELGATPVRYGAGLAGRVLALGAVDAVFDAAGKGVLADAIALAGGPRRVITLADPAAADFGVTFSQYTTDRAPGALDETIALLADGRLRLRAHTSMPMQQAAEAHRQLESGTVHERIILTLE
jgi:NADPH:quinone reductase-like Zn-dependent oxidoreductase